jgi:predicted AlkP superfamily phosphohydrolase/phosphomutase
MLLVVGWDGASFELARPWIEDGSMPVLADVLARGASRPLRSTVPAVTFPAWTSFMTAASPSRHGVLDFTLRKQGYGVRFASSADRCLPSAWAAMSAAGLQVGVYGFPATWPPEELSAFQLCGFDTPMGAGDKARRSSPPGLAGELERLFGDLAVSGPQQSRIDAGWHERALEQMLGDIELRTEISLHLLTGNDLDCFAVHYGETDTVGHHFWQFHDCASPRYSEDGPGDAIAEVYRAVDRALGRLLEATGKDSDLLLLSDHGSGGSSDRTLFLNRFLADNGWLGFKKTGGLGTLASIAKRTAMAVAPPSLQASLFSRLRPLVNRMESASRFGGIDWTGTSVYSEELNYYPSLWFNLKGREPGGIVDAADLPAMTGELVAELLEWRDPEDGLPVVQQVRSRDELFDGPHAEFAPDLVLELRQPGGYSYAGGNSRAGAERQSIRRMTSREMSGERGSSMPGCHRDLGMFAMAGPGVLPGRGEEGSLADAGATMLALLGLGVPSAPAGVSRLDGADGKPWQEQLRVPARALREVEVAPAAGDGQRSPAAENELADRLRDLGYLP